MLNRVNKVLSYSFAI